MVGGIDARHADVEARSQCAVVRAVPRLVEAALLVEGILLTLQQHHAPTVHRSPAAVGEICRREAAVYLVVLLHAKPEELVLANAVRASCRFPDALDRGKQGRRDEEEHDGDDDDALADACEDPCGVSSRDVDMVRGLHLEDQGHPIPARSIPRDSASAPGRHATFYHRPDRTAIRRWPSGGRFPCAAQGY